MPGELEQAVAEAAEAEEMKAIDRVERSIDWDATEVGPAVGDWVVLTQAIPPEMTAGGLFIPPNARDKHYAFPTVVAVGSEVPDLTPGDQVVLVNQTGISTADYVIIRQPRADQQPLMAVRRKYIATAIKVSHRATVDVEVTLSEAAPS